MDLFLGVSTRDFSRHKKDKDVDYRDVTPYWCHRLLRLDGTTRTIKYWTNLFKSISGTNAEFVKQGIKDGSITFRKYDILIISNKAKGAKDAPQILRSLDSIEIGVGVIEWGAPKHEVFKILGHKIISRINC